MMMEPIATDQLQTYSIDAVVCKCAAITEIRVAREQASNNQHHLQENDLIKKKSLKSMLEIMVAGSTHGVVHFSATRSYSVA